MSESDDQKNSTNASGKWESLVRETHVVQLEKAKITLRKEKVALFGAIIVVIGLIVGSPILIGMFSSGDDEQTHDEVDGEVDSEIPDEGGDERTFILEFNFIYQATSDGTINVGPCPAANDQQAGTILYGDTIASLYRPDIPPNEKKTVDKGGDQLRIKEGMYFIYGSMIPDALKSDQEAYSFIGPTAPERIEVFVKSID